jgi:molybdopterin converting factor small subunit
MKTKISFSSTFFELTKAWSLEVDGATLREVIDNLSKRYPGVKKAICADNESEIRRGLIVSIDNEIVRTIDVPVPEGANIDIDRATSGG